MYGLGFGERGIAFFFFFFKDALSFIVMEENVDFGNKIENVKKRLKNKLKLVWIESFSLTLKSELLATESCTLQTQMCYCASVFFGFSKELVNEKLVDNRYFSLVPCCTHFMPWKLRCLLAYYSKCHACM